MPWIPELFSASVRERLERKWELERLDLVPYYDGLMSGEHAALTRSFAGEPVLHDPLHGRVTGERAFGAYVAQLNAWLAQHSMSFEPVDDVITETRAFEEVVLHLDGQAGRVAVPVAIIADRRSDGRLAELRVYHSMWPVMGRYVHRPPLLQGDPELRTSDVVGEHQRALAAGDVDAIVAAFEPDGYPASRRAASTSTQVATTYAPSMGCCFRTAAGSRWNTAPQSTTGAYAYSSTTW